MKRTTFIAAVFALAGSVVFAQSALDSAIKALTDQGFTNIEVKSGAATAKIEAVNGTQKVEITIDLANGTVLKRESESLGADGTTADDSTDDSDDDSDDDSGHHGGNSGNSGHGSSSDD